MKSSARSTDRARPSRIVSLVTLLSSSSCFSAATKIKSQQRSVATWHLAAAAADVEPETNPSDSSGYTRSEP